VDHYSLRDVERLLNVKLHVLRYWEKEISLVQPGRDNQGHLHYSDRDLQIFLRLKYLVQDRHFTLEGARDELYRELAGEYQDLRSEIAALRSELTDLYFLVKKEDEGDKNGNGIVSAPQA
jgi:DNA-binding transcriptional MerR regulator